MNRDQILAFRLHQHHLTRRLPLAQLEDAAAAGIQHTIPGTAPVALGLRVEGFTPTALEAALRKKKSLVEITGLRGASYIVPSKDFYVFTRAAFPTEEKDLERLLGPAWKLLRTKKLGASQALEKFTVLTLARLHGRALTQDEIHAEWRKRLPKEFLYPCRGCGTSHVPYSLVMALGIQGTFCFGPRKEDTTAYVRADEWLDTRKIETDLERLRAELVRKFLRFYGPGTPRGLAAWAGVSLREAQALWELVEGELAEIAGAQGWILKRDRATLDSPPTPRKACLLPPRDAFLNLPDRETLVADKARRSKVWRILGNPGVFLLDGEPAGCWRMQKKGERLDCSFQPFGKITQAERQALEEQAEALVALRECRKLQISPW